MMKTVLLTDLDSTLFSSSSKSDISERVSIGAYNVRGEPTSHISKTQQGMIKFMGNYDTIIPVTARTLEQYVRVNETLRSMFSSYSVLCDGALIMVDNRLDTDWMNMVLDSCLVEQSPVLKRLSSYLNSNKIEHTVNSIYGHDYTIHINNVNTITQRRVVNCMCDRALFDISVNGNYYIVKPKGISKELAVEYLMGTYLTSRSITTGFGDSDNDKGFMSMCDYAITPTNSQIWVEK